jgi:hypothetical protein
MSTADILRTARALVVKGWTQGAFARPDETDDDEVEPDDPSAVCFCMLGAVRAVAAAGDQESAESMLEGASELLYPERCAQRETHNDEESAAVLFNDHWDTGIEDVLRVFDAAIEGYSA